MHHEAVGALCKAGWLDQSVLLEMMLSLLMTLEMMLSLLMTLEMMLSLLMPLLTIWPVSFYSSCLNFRMLMLY